MLFTTQAHALKSAAANIGAMDVSTRAAIIENLALSNDVDRLAGLIPKFKEDLIRLIADIKKALPKDDLQASQDETEKQEIYNLWQSLIDALKDGNIRNIDLISAQLHEKKLSETDRLILEEVDEHVLMSDFDDAVVSISKLRKGADL